MTTSHITTATEKPLNKCQVANGRRKWYLHEALGPPHRCLVMGLVMICVYDKLTEYHSKLTYPTNPNPLCFSHNPNSNPNPKNYFLPKPIPFVE